MAELRLPTDRQPPSPRARPPMLPGPPNQPPSPQHGNRPTTLYQTASSPTMAKNRLVKAKHQLPTTENSPQLLPLYNSPKSHAVWKLSETVEGSLGDRPRNRQHPVSPLHQHHGRTAPQNRTSHHQSQDCIRCKGIFRATITVHDIIEHAKNQNVPEQRAIAALTKFRRSYFSKTRNMINQELRARKLSSHSSPANTYAMDTTPDATPKDPDSLDNRKQPEHPPDDDDDEESSSVGNAAAADEPSHIETTGSNKRKAKLTPAKRKILHAPASQKRAKNAMSPLNKSDDGRPPQLPRKGTVRRQEQETRRMQGQLPQTEKPKRQTRQWQQPQLSQLWRQLQSQPQPQQEQQQWRRETTTTPQQEEGQGTPAKKRCKSRRIATRGQRRHHTAHQRQPHPIFDAMPQIHPTYASTLHARPMTSVLLHSAS
jgi:hypothetical protein